MTTTTTCLLSITLIVALGLPQAFVLTRSPGLSLFVAPLLTALNVTIAIMIMLLAGGSLLPWVAVIVIPQYAILPQLFRRALPPLPVSRTADIAWTALPVLPPLIQVLSPPTTWDANSIWWFHAIYFSKGAEFARDAIGNVSLAFTHPDYPAFPSAPVALAWSIFSGYSLHLAQAVSALTNFCAIVMLVYVVRVLTSQAPTLVSRVVAAGVGFAVWGTASWTVAGGMADPLWSCLLVAAALLMLIGRDWFARPALPLLFLAGAALSKNEGMIMALTLAAIVTLKYRKKLRRAWIVWIPIAAGVGWMGLSRLLGATSDVASGSNISGLLTGDSEVLGRLAPTLATLWDFVGPAVVMALIVAIAGTVFLHQRRQSLGLASDGWLWTLGTLYGIFLVTTYLISPHELNWYLETSAERVCLPFLLLACASMACWTATATCRVPMKTAVCGDESPAPADKEYQNRSMAPSKRV